MPILPPVAASGAREPERAARRIPSKVRACVVDMVNEGLDLVAASKQHGVRPATLRTWLHRPEVAALVRKERQAFRLAISCGTECALVDIRDNREGNQMARVAAAKAICEIDREEYARPAADRPSPGITLKFVTYQTSASAPPIVNITPKPQIIDSGDSD
jgi:hypothetical protein